MNSDSRKTLISRLRRGPAVRQRLVDSHLAKGLAYQIRAMRERLGWTQSVLAEKLDTNQNAVYRLESPDYGKATLTTLKKVAAAMDVALVVRFVPFSELVDWVSGTPHLSNGLDYSALNVQPFDDEETDGIFDRSQVNIRQAVQPPPTL